MIEILTDREQEVAARVAAARSNRQIASELGLAEQTVKNHLRAIFLKLGCENRTELALSMILSTKGGSQ